MIDMILIVGVLLISQIFLTFLVAQKKSGKEESIFEFLFYMSIVFIPSYVIMNFLSSYVDFTFFIELLYILIYLIIHYIQLRIATWLLNLYKIKYNKVNQTD